MQPRARTSEREKLGAARHKAANNADAAALEAPLVPEAPVTDADAASAGTAANEAAIREFAQRRHLPESSVEAWRALGADAARMLLELAATLKLRTGQLVAVLELLPEIALRESVSPSAVLARSEIKRIGNAPGSGPGRAREFLRLMRAMRYPRLGRALSELQRQVAALRMPPGVGITLPKELSSGELVIELRASSAAELDGALSALHEQREQLARIFDLLGGANEF